MKRYRHADGTLHTASSQSSLLSSQGDDRGSKRSLSSAGSLDDRPDTMTKSASATEPLSSSAAVAPANAPADHNEQGMSAVNY